MDLSLFRKNLRVPKGFKAAAISAGIKKSKSADLALVFSEKPCKAATLFTVNEIKAAHIKVCRQHLKKSKRFQALLVNSGNANCFTGQKGVRDAEVLTAFLAGKLHLKNKEVLVASTGIIGRRLPLEKIKKAIPLLIKDLKNTGFAQITKAIMTTDTFPKVVVKKLKLAGKTVNLCAFAKGAGMISPNLATMLCFILTDAAITQSALGKALRLAAKDSFNCITVDGCMSTNDTLIALANGEAGNSLIAKNKHFNQFSSALKNICLGLAKMIIQDAEGATKFITIKVNGAKTDNEAKKVALNIANSNLFKTAIYGENPNFGRIVSSVGASKVKVKEKELKIYLSPLNKKKINVKVSLRRGKAAAVVYTSDLTPQYVKINAEYN